MAKFTRSEEVLIEHYVYTTATAAVVLWHEGHHNIHTVLWAALLGVIAPVVAKLNPRGSVAKLAKEEHLSASTTAAIQTVAASAVADAQKVVAKAAIDAATDVAK
jgi:hypothetical protein